MFENNDKITEIPQGSIRIVGENAFLGCSNITKAVLPDSVRGIGMNAFANCTSLTSIEYKGTKKEWSKISFGKDWNLNVPATTVICLDATVEL